MARALSSIDEMERMTMPNAAHDAAAEDELAEAFPGIAITHLLTITTRDPLSAAIAALEAIRASGGGLEALSLARFAGGLDHRLRIVGLRPHQARRLADRIAALPGVDRAAVEHQLLRP